jgi:hypothetical protein
VKHLIVFVSFVALAAPAFALPEIQETHLNNGDGSTTYWFTIESQPEVSYLRMQIIGDLNQIQAHAAIYASVGPVWAPNVIFKSDADLANATDAIYGASANLDTWVDNALFPGIVAAGLVPDAGDASDGSQEVNIALTSFTGGLGGPLPGGFIPLAQVTIWGSELWLSGVLQSISDEDGSFEWHAVPEPTTLKDLFAGETITADDKLFSNWTLLETPQIENGGLVDLSQIEVTPLTDDPLNPGIKFTAPDGALGTPASHTGLSSASLHFSYTVETTSGQPLIKDNSLLLNDFSFDAGSDASIRISETLTDTSGASLGGKEVIAVPGDTPGTGNPNHFDSADFALQSVVQVETLIEIEGSGDNDLASVRMFEQRFSQVPEPDAHIIALLGMLGLLGRAWRW